MYTENLKTGQAYRVLIGEDVEENHIYDRLSFWTAASDVEFADHTTLEDIRGTFFYTSGTLQARETEVTISGELITNDGLLDIYVPDEYCAKAVPSSVTRTTGTVVITFPPQEENMEVRVVCKNYTQYNAGG